MVIETSDFAFIKYSFAGNNSSNFVAKIIMILFQIEKLHFAMVLVNYFYTNVFYVADFTPYFNEFEHIVLI